MNANIRPIDLDQGVGWMRLRKVRHSRDRA